MTIQGIGVDKKGLLAGFQVLELASVLAGPSIAMFLAELGASVIKVENPHTKGDVTRAWKLPSESEATSLSAYFSAVNWGKASVAVDLNAPEGLKLVKELAAQSDIVITSFKPGDAEKLGLTYESLSKYNDKLIYGSVTGFRPLDPRVGYDAIIQAESGFTYLNGQPDGPPTKMPVALMDLLAAHQLKEGLLTALLKRQLTGEGDHITVSLFQAGISALANQATNWLVGGEIPQRMGSAHPNIAPYGDVLYTADQQPVVLAIGNDRQFASLCLVIGATDIADNPSYQTNQQRVQNRNNLIEALAEKLAYWKADELLPALHEARIPIGRVQDMKQVMDTPEAQGLQVTDQELTGLRQIAFGSEKAYQPLDLSAPPAFASHTTSILSNKLNYSTSAIDQLMQSGVTYQANYSWE